MRVLFETKNFSVGIPPQPHVDRLDGGHIVILPKDVVEDRTELPVESAIELMVLSLIVGTAMKVAMNRRGVDIERINYQDNGNWVPVQHLHLYGRAKSARVQKYGSALYFPDPDTGFYESVQPLDETDIEEVVLEIHKLSLSDRYSKYTSQFIT